MHAFKKYIAASAMLASAGSGFTHTISAQDHVRMEHHGAHASPHAAANQQPWGIAGQATASTRTINLRMTDDMRFTPNQIHVKLGETVRIRVANAGQVMHEIVLGTAQTLDAHAQAMLQQPGMAHGEAFMAHVPPQANGELVWTFNRPGTFDFACLIAGHYQAGMRGTVTVTP